MNHPIKSSMLCRASLACAAALIGGACGSSAPTQELVDARRTYNEAAASEAARLTPDKLLEAQQALERAEAEHEDDPGSPDEAHLAYLASRKSAIAMASGKIAAAKETEQESEQRYQDALRENAEQSQSQLSQTQDALNAERQRSQEAQARAAAALQRLANIAKVNEESRGTVITLPGAVLFPSGGKSLSAPARQSLDKVAEALTEQPSGARIVVEGHTDARGSDESNQKLSQARADAVRDYLVSQGLDSERVSAVGRGEGSPIADNDTAEGRATNRRVEIVVSGDEGAGATGTSQDPAAQPGPASSPVMPGDGTPGAPPTPSEQHEYP